MLADADRTGFVLALARAARGAPLYGFAYRLPRWQLALLAGQGAPSGGQPPFEFCELAVRPSARGCGVGAALHDAVTARDSYSYGEPQSSAVTSIGFGT